MKQLILFIILSISFNLKAQNNTDLIPFTVTYYTGDEVIERYEINVYKEDSIFFAEQICPPLAFSKSDTIWKVELNKEKREMCLNFLDKARTLPHQCPVTSTNHTSYNIYSEIDTIRIRGKCDWDGLYFTSLQDNFFEENYKNWKLEKDSITKSVNEKILGKWYLSVPLSSLKSYDYVTLKRTKDDCCDEFFEFSENNSFSSSTSKNFNDSQKYELSISEKAYLEIEWSFDIDSKGKPTVINKDVTFILESIQDDKIKLKYLWKY